LGLLIDESLTFHDHIKQINAKIKFKSQQLIHHKRAISSALFPTIFKSTVMPYVDFSLPLFGHCTSLYLLQDSIDFFLKCYYVKGYAYRRFHYVNDSKAVNNAHDPSLGKVKQKSRLKPVGTNDMLSFYERFGLQTVHERAAYLTLTTLHTILNLNHNKHLQELFVTSSDQSRHSSRLLNLATHRVSPFARTSFRHRAIKFFNSLTPQLKSQNLTYPFRDGLRAWLTQKRLNNYVFFKKIVFVCLLTWFSPGILF
jgi:hypothetical protein